MLYELKVKEYSEIPVYNGRNFRQECHGTGAPYTVELKGFLKILHSFLGFLISATKIQFLSLAIITIIIIIS